MPFQKEPSALRKAAVGAALVATLGTALAIPIPPQGETQSALVDVLSSGKHSKELRAITEKSQAVLRFAQPLELFGVGDPTIAEVERITSDTTSKSLMVTAKAVGRTTLTVGFKDGVREQYVFDVRRDLSVLETALRAIHPTIEASIAPDRDAVILTGAVPEGSFAARASQAAADYVAAGATGEKASQGKVINLIRVEMAAIAVETRVQAELERLGGQNLTLRRVQQGQNADDTKDVFVLGGQVPSISAADDALQLVRAAIGSDEKGARIVNQLQITDRPTSIESVIEKAIHEQVGCPKVRVQRVANADVSGDMDILVLTGSVPNQTKLVQTLALTSKVFQQQELVKRKRAGEIERVTEAFASGETRTTDRPLQLKESTDDIKVSSDESGALHSTSARSVSNSGLRSILGAGNSSSFGGSDVGDILTNNLTANLARAKSVELAEGRIVSFLSVDAIQQVRVDVRFYEVSRTALLEWDSNLKASVADNNGTFTDVNGDPIPSPSSNTDVKNVLSFLGGTLGNQLTVNGDHFAIDSLLTLLESEGIAKSLSSPSLTVLSGEIAAFGDGGSFFIRSSVATSVGGGAGVLTQDQEFKFGVRLAVRPLADEDGFITLDVVPSISSPDSELSAQIRAATGTNLTLPALVEKNMKTSARLRDGDVLLIGGLTQHSRKDSADKTPGLHQIPVLGWLFKDFKYEDNDKELVIVVNPVIVRDRPTEALLWSYPTADELLGRTARKQEAAQAVDAKTAPAPKSDAAAKK